MSGLEVLKIKIYQPQAHYRVPFTYQRRHTYPIPPYSTVVGLICNILGIKNEKGEGEPCENKNCNCKYHKLKNIKISVCGTFSAKTTEYTWFRNLSKKSHHQRFGSLDDRSVSGHIEHIGGQMPVPIDILNDVHLWIYLCHNDKSFLKEIKESFEKPQRRLYPLHLGRAEDWIAIEKIDFTNIEIAGGYHNFSVFVWIPEKIYPQGSLNFDEVSGLLYKIPTFYILKDGIRNFNYEKVKLNDGLISGIEFYCDNDENKPVFLLNNEG